MRALSLRSVTAVLEAPLRNGGQLMDWAYVLLHRPDDCGVAMNSNFFPPTTARCEVWPVGPPGLPGSGETRQRAHGGAGTRPGAADAVVERDSWRCLAEPGAARATYRPSGRGAFPANEREVCPRQIAPCLNRGPLAARSGRRCRYSSRPV